MVAKAWGAAETAVNACARKAGTGYDMEVYQH